MRLERVELEGFRGYASLTSVEIDDLTILAGKNDAGKSSVFDALNVFFMNAKLDKHDFNVAMPGPVKISCTFSDLPPQLVLDQSATTTLKDEYLLTADGELRITKEWSSATGKPSTYARAEHPALVSNPDGSQSLLLKKHAELKTLVQKLDCEGQVKDKRLNAAHRAVVWEQWINSGQADLRTIDVPLSKEDGKAIAEALDRYMPLFHLFRSDRLGTESDAAAQDPAKLAVKSVLEQHEKQLGELTVQVEAQLERLLGDVVDKLADVDPSLAAQLSPASVKPDWSKAFGSLQFVDDLGVPLAKRGSGTRRLVLLSFFRAEVEIEQENTTEEWRRGIMIAVEEPETALHPDMQEEVIEVLKDVSNLDRRQVLLTTHSSNLLRNVPIDAVRFAERVGQSTSWHARRNEDTKSFLRRLASSMGTFTDHNVRCFLFVEGANDIGGIRALSAALHKLRPDSYPDVESLEKSGALCFIPIGGCGSAELWENRLHELHRSEIHILDSDRTSPTDPLSNSIARYEARYAGDDSSAKVTVLDRRELENYLTKDAVLSIYSHRPGFTEEFDRKLEESTSDWNYLDVPRITASALGRQGDKSVKKDLVSAFGHPSVAASLLKEETGVDLLEVLRSVNALVLVSRA